MIDDCPVIESDHNKLMQFFCLTFQHERSNYEKNPDRVEPYYVVLEDLVEMNRLLMLTNDIRLMYNIPFLITLDRQVGLITMSSLSSSQLSKWSN